MLCYIDDLSVFSSSLSITFNIVRHCFSQKLRKAGLTIKSEEFYFVVEKVLYLGHIIATDGAEVNTSYSDTVRNHFRTKTQRDGHVQLLEVVHTKCGKYFNTFESSVAKRRPFKWSVKCADVF